MLHDLQAVLGIFLLEGIWGELDFEAMNSNQIVHYGKATRKMCEHQTNRQQMSSSHQFLILNQKYPQERPKRGPYGPMVLSHQVHWVQAAVQHVLATAGRQWQATTPPRPGKIGSPIYILHIYHVGKNHVINHP